MTAKIVKLTPRRADGRRLHTVQCRPSVHLTGHAYPLLYRHGLVNHCPGCSGTAWHIGNQTAECARCETALDLERAVR